jgi:hydrogenase maturation factor
MVIPSLVSLTSSGMRMSREQSTGRALSMWTDEPRLSTIVLNISADKPTPAQGSTEVDVKQEEIDNSAARLPVTHLVLCVHGIGQNLIAANIAGAAPSFASAVLRITLLSTSPSCPVCVVTMKLFSTSCSATSGHLAVCLRPRPLQHTCLQIVSRCPAFAV